MCQVIKLFKNKVAPHAGAWIEMYKSALIKNLIVGRTSRRCVD
ncbi:hypothetical protein SFBNYU_008780 [Candidatus Arthromitus sp. SFB-mouse-NYU]|nr:hypothetical protein SFBNYU_008780 [Candidatus Arthromitus sp. SFB-mouse-NYU]